MIYPVCHFGSGGAGRKVTVIIRGLVFLARYIISICVPSFVFAQPLPLPSFRSMMGRVRLTPPFLHPIPPLFIRSVYHRGKEGGRRTDGILEKERAWQKQKQTRAEQSGADIPFSISFLLGWHIGLLSFCEIYMYEPWYEPEMKEGELIHLLKFGAQLNGKSNSN